MERGAGKILGQSQGSNRGRLGRPMQLPGGSKAKAQNTLKGLIPTDAQVLMQGSANRLKMLAPDVNKDLQSLSDPNNLRSVATLLTQLSVAVLLWRQRKGHGIGANVRAAVVNKANQIARSMRLARIRRQHRAKQNANKKKNGTCSTTCCSISFAMGTETFTHSDFTLPGPFPLVWSRTYYSNLAAYNKGVCGARWINEFTTRFDIKQLGAQREELRYHAADGRTH